MSIFGKKPSHDDSDSTSEDRRKNNNDIKDRDEKRTVKVKKLKDLNSENRKRRKEPIRTWNKFDRIFIFLILLLTVGSSSFMALSSRGYKLPDLPRINVPKLNLFGERVVVLDSGKNNKQVADKVIAGFSQVTNGLSGIYGLYVVNLINDSSFGIYENENFPAASLIKLPVMLGMYMEEESESLSLSTSYKLRSDDKIKGSGSLYNKPVGYQLTYRDLIRLMGRESDNTAYNICRKYLGDKKIQKIINQIGMNDTNLIQNETTAKDMGLLLQKLWNGELISKGNSDEMLNFLTDTIYEDWLAAGIPGDMRIAHKYGREIKTVNDAGIVYSEEPYVIVVLSKDIVLKDADYNFPKLSQTVYQGMAGSGN